MPKLIRTNKLLLFKPDKTSQVFEQVEDVEIHSGHIVFSHSSRLGNGTKTTRYITSFSYCFEEVMSSGKE